MTRMSTPIRRREFLQTSTLFAAGIALAGCAGKASRDNARTLTNSSLVGFCAAPMETVRIGFIGVGGRGSGLIREFMRCPGVQINAVCDVKPDRAARAQDILVKANLPRPESYSGSDETYKALNDRNDIDLIINATPQRPMQGQVFAEASPYQNILLTQLCVIEIT
jgi:shikimate 5-dehydrogenase